MDRRYITGLLLMLAALVVAFSVRMPELVEDTTLEQFVGKEKKSFAAEHGEKQGLVHLADNDVQATLAPKVASLINHPGAVGKSVTGKELLSGSYSPITSGMTADKHMSFDRLTVVPSGGEPVTGAPDGTEVYSLLPRAMNSKPRVLVTPELAILYDDTSDDMSYADVLADGVVMTNEAIQAAQIKDPAQHAKVEEKIKIIEY